MISKKAIGEITWADVELLVTQRAEESATLEFKSGEIYSHREGKSDRSIANEARDTIAKEVAALANAYGGLIIIGVAESRDVPRCADKLVD